MNNIQIINSHPENADNGVINSWNVDEKNLNSSTTIKSNTSDNIQIIPTNNKICINFEVNTIEKINTQNLITINKSIINPNIIPSNNIIDNSSIVFNKSSETRKRKRNVEKPEYKKNVVEKKIIKSVKCVYNVANLYIINVQPKVISEKNVILILITVIHI